MSLSDQCEAENGATDPRESEISQCQGVQGTGGDPINTRTGNFAYSLVDLSLNTVAGPLSFQRSYASQATDIYTGTNGLGYGWAHNQGARLIVGEDEVWFKGHTANQYKFYENGDGTYTPYPGVMASLEQAGGVYTATTSSRSVYTFDADGLLTSWQNELGYGFVYSYTNGILERASEPLSGRYLQFGYTGDRLTSVTDNAGRGVGFGYDGNGDLVSFTDVMGKTWTYVYDASHHLTEIKDPSDPPKTVLKVDYDAQGRAYRQWNGENEIIVELDFGAGGATTIEDGLGRSSAHGYDGRNLLAQGTDAAGYDTYWTYDANFRPVAITDEDERTTTLEWSTDGARLTYVKDAEDYETHLEYDSQNHLRRVLAPEGREVTFDYAGGLPVSSTLHLSGTLATTVYSYTTAADYPQPPGLLKAVVDPLERRTNFVYDEKGQLVALLDALENETQFGYDATGRITETVRVLGQDTQQVTRLEYDDAGQVTKVVRNYDPARPQNDDNLYNLTSQFFYDDHGRLTLARDTLGNETEYVYDDAGRLVEAFDAEDNPTGYAYNDAGQLVSVTDPLTHTTQLVYDEDDGRLERVVDGRSIPTVFTYNPDGTVETVSSPASPLTYTLTYHYDDLKRATGVTDNAGHAAWYTLDAYGNVLAAADALGRTTKYEYNLQNLLTAVTQNYIENPAPGYDPLSTNVRTEYAYDLAGNLTKVWDANSVAAGHAYAVEYEYDPLDRLKKITDPLDNETLYTYDDADNRVTRLDANQATTVFGYDLADRLESVDYPGGTAQDVLFEYDPLGQVTDMYDSLGHTQWTWNDLGQITAISDPFDRTVGYGYDAAGRRSSLTYPDQRTLSYEYNEVNQLAKVSEGGEILAEYSYAGNSNRLETVVLRDVISSTEVITSTYAYDLSGQATGITHRNQDGELLSSFVYGYDDAGNRQVVTDTLFIPDDTLPGGGVYTTTTIAYEYDPLYRLTEAIYSTGSVYTYTYDRAGNRTAMGAPSGATAYLYNQANQLTHAEGVTQTWDANGNLLHDGVYTYTYDYENRLVSVSSEQSTVFSAEYNGLGERYRGVENGETISYTLDLAAALPQALTDGRYTYLYGLGRIAQQDPTGVTSFFLPDALGSVRQMAGANGDVLLTQSFDPFGNPLLRQGALTSPFGYAGEWTLSGESSPTGLQYLRARYYSPLQGRFLTRDPFPGLLGLPATQHPYAYALNNPVLYSDPSGMIVPLLAAALGGAAIGFVAGGIIGAAGYAISIYFSGGKFCWSDFWTVTGVGALSGAFIGSGIGLLALIGAGAAAGGAGYLVGNMLTQAQFQAEDFLIAYAVGGVLGALTPWATTVWRMTLLGGLAGGTQFTVTRLSHGEKPDAAGLGVSIILGGASGYITGGFVAPSWSKVSSPFLSSTVVRWLINRKITEEVIETLPLSFTLGGFSNLPTDWFRTIMDYIRIKAIQRTNVVQ